MNHMNQPVSPEHKHPHDHAHGDDDHGHAAHGHSCCGASAAPALVQLTEKASAQAQLSRFRIDAMDCPTEQTLIQDKLGALDVEGTVLMDPTKVGVGISKYYKTSMA